MSEKYKAWNLGELYFVTITTVDWVDLLTRPAYKEVILDFFRYCQQAKGLNIHAFVIMTNHWHAILSSNDLPLADVMRDLKKFTSKKLISTMDELNEAERSGCLRNFNLLLIV